MTPRLLVVGGTRGFGQEVCDFFGSSALGVGRSNGYDIGKAEDRRRLVEMSLEYDIFFNHAHNGHIEGQTQLLLDVFEAWAREKKSGSIFTTGSYATYMNLKSYRRYAVIKFLHDQVVQHLCEKILYDQLPFRLTNFRPGTLENQDGTNPQKNKLKGRDLAAVILSLHQNPAPLMVQDLVLSGN